MPPGAELRVWYGAFYAKKMNKPTLRPPGQAPLPAPQSGRMTVGCCLGRRGNSRLHPLTPIFFFFDTDGTSLLAKTDICEAASTHLTSGDDGSGGTCPSLLPRKPREPFLVMARDAAALRHRSNEKESEEAIPAKCTFPDVVTSALFLCGCQATC